MTDGLRAQCSVNVSIYHHQIKDPNNENEIRYATYVWDGQTRELLGKDLDMASKSIKEIVKCGHNLKLLFVIRLVPAKILK